MSYGAVQSGDSIKGDRIRVFLMSNVRTSWPPALLSQSDGDMEYNEGINTPLSLLWKPSSWDAATEIGVIVVWSLTNQPQTFRPYTIQVKNAMRGIGPKRSVDQFPNPSKLAALWAQSVNHSPTLYSIWIVASTKYATKLTNDCRKRANMNLY